jgi:hypothetical protein
MKAREARNGGHSFLLFEKGSVLFGPDMPIKFPDASFEIDEGSTLTAMLGNQGTRLSDNVRQVECWFSQLTLSHLPSARYALPFRSTNCQT